jgi:methylenetetrahydrofolate--tRNA-(uracil-5-)-methyltransferase
MTHQIHIIGGGMAGSEAAWQLARRGFRVRLSEMRGSGETTAAHQGDGLAELVCSNSFRSDDDEKNAVGLLHHEMRRCDSLIMAAADKARVPAGSALAVDRDVFSAAVEAALRELPNLELVRERVDTLPSEGMVIVATGPLTAASLASSIGTAPARKAWRSSMPLPRSSIAIDRHGRVLDGQPLGQGRRPGKHRQGLHQLPDEQGAVPGVPPGPARRRKDRVQGMGSQHPYFDGCMPIEVMAERARTPCALAR